MADIALSSKDRRWLISSADRIATDAGELSEAFSGHTNAITPRIETLLYLARRMRRAPVWQDSFGFRNARDDFNRMWLTLRPQLARQPRKDLAAVDESLTLFSRSGAGTDGKALYAAIQRLR